MKKQKGQEAKFGERMIEVKVCFWTNQIAAGKGKIKPKHAWDSGVVRLERNKTHGIIPQNPVPFHSPFDLTKVIESVLIQHGISLHHGHKTRKYYVEN
jgi:hypothetical protein